MSGSTAKPLRYAGDYHEDLSLNDGTQVRIRLVRPADKALLRDGFEKLSPESRYRRFFCAKTRLSERELAYLTELDGIDHFALGAVRLGAEGTEVPLGIARFIRLPANPAAAEAAIAVVDDYQRHGLGRLLLERLIAAAAERGITHFHADVVAGNPAVRAWLAEASSQVAERLDGSGVFAVDLLLPVVPPPGAGPQEAARTSAPYHLLRETARDRAELTATLVPEE